MRKRGRETSMCEIYIDWFPLACPQPPTMDPDWNPGMCPDWESNQRPFGSPASTQFTKPHQPGPGLFNECFISTIGDTSFWHQVTRIQGLAVFYGTWVQPASSIALVPDKLHRRAKGFILCRIATTPKDCFIVLKCYTTWLLIPVAHQYRNTHFMTLKDPVRMTGI